MVKKGPPKRENEKKSAKKSERERDWMRNQDCVLVERTTKRIKKKESTNFMGLQVGTV